MPETGVRSPDPSLRHGWRDRSDAGSAHILMSDCQKSPAQIGNPRRILSGARMSGGIQGLWCWLVLWHFFFPLPADNWAWIWTWWPLLGRWGHSCWRKCLYHEAFLGHSTAQEISAAC